MTHDPVDWLDEVTSTGFAGEGSGVFDGTKYHTTPVSQQLLPLVESMAPLLNQLTEAVLIHDLKRRVVYANPAAVTLMGYPASELLGSSCATRTLCHVDHHGLELCNGGNCQQKSPVADGETRRALAHFRHRDGHALAVVTLTTPLMSGGVRVGMTEVLREVTDHAVVSREEVEVTRRLAFEDALTGLPNRRLLEQRLAYLSSKLRWRGRGFGVLMVDVDHFKSVNDEHGHQVGDQVLKLLARTLQANIRPEDTVGRWGGEEFVVLVPQVDEPTLIQVAERLRHLVQRSSLTLNSGRTLSVTISLGATLSTLEDSAESLLERVDSLLYSSKRAGRNRTTWTIEAEPAVNTLRSLPLVKEVGNLLGWRSRS